MINYGGSYALDMVDNGGKADNLNLLTGDRNGGAGGLSGGFGGFKLPKRVKKFNSFEAGGLLSPVKTPTPAAPQAPAGGAMALQLPTPNYAAPTPYAADAAPGGASTTPPANPAPTPTTTESTSADALNPLGAPVANPVDPLGLMGGGGPGPMQQASEWLIGQVPKQPAWWNNKENGNWGEFLQQYWKGPGDTSYQARLKQLRVAPGTNLNTTDPSSPFYDINMEKLKTEAPWLYTKVMNLTGPNPNNLGDTYKFLVGRLGRAITGEDPVKDWQIRNSGLDIRNEGAADWLNQKDSMVKQQAQADSLDSGDSQKSISVAGSEADAASAAAARNQVSSLLGFNQEYRQKNLSNAISALSEWAANKRARRMSDAGVTGDMARASIYADAQNQADTYGLASSLLGAASSYAGGGSGTGG